MKNINHATKTAFRFFKALFLIILLSSFTPYNPPLSSCQHDFELKDSYSINRPETVIVKALRDYGFDIKRGLDEVENENSQNHTWRLLNVRTKYGVVKEITIQIGKDGTDIFPTTKISLVRICLNEELTKKELNTKIKKYRTFFKKDIIGKLKKYNG